MKKCRYERSKEEKSRRVGGEKMSDNGDAENSFTWSMRIQRSKDNIVYKNGQW